MNKIVVYTSNLDVNPKNMGDVIEFAKSKPKFYIANVENSDERALSSVKPGDNIITKKGNSIDVIRTFEDTPENLSEEDRAYLVEIKGAYGARNVNITSVGQIVKFETWCKSAKPFINLKSETKMKNSISGLSARLKELYTPVEAKDVRVTANGDICVETKNGFVAIDANGKLNSYVEELTYKLPCYIMSKPATALQPGDIIALDKSYAKVTEVKGDKISAIGYTGASKSIHTINDVLFNQTMVRVVVSLAGNLGGGALNPLMLMLLSDEDGKSSKKDLLPLLMMSQNGGALQANPLMMLALTKDGEGSSMKDLLMLSAMSGNGMNLFAGLGAQPAPATNATGAAQAIDPKAAE